MMRTVTATAVNRIMTKGLTGWEAGKLVLQDLIDTWYGKDPILTETDLTALQQTPMEGADVKDYNMFIALCRGFYIGWILAEWTCRDIFLEIRFLDHALEDAAKRRTIELFESFGPQVVTRKQYDEIVAAQREKKLALEFGLDHVIEERFYAIAPPEARSAMDEARVDIESAEQFAAAVPGSFVDYHKQAVEEIRGLCSSGRLPVTYCEEDAREVEPLLKQWKGQGLPLQEVMKLAERLCVTVQALYDCPELPEWKSFVDEYQQLWLDDDGSSPHVYAVLDDCPEFWLDQNGHYKPRMCPAELVTQSQELLVGLATDDGKAGESISGVASGLKAKLDSAEQDIRLFLAIKAVLDAAAEAVELQIPGGKGLFTWLEMKVNAHIDLYNLRLERLKVEGSTGRSPASRLEKALKTLPALDADRLKPSPDSLKQLKGKILEDARSEAWLAIKLRSLGA
jgi:hypothetical protein